MNSLWYKHHKFKHIMTSFVGFFLINVLVAFGVMIYRSTVWLTKPQSIIYLHPRETLPSLMFAVFYVGYPRWSSVL